MKLKSLKSVLALTAAFGIAFAGVSCNKTDVTTSGGEEKGSGTAKAEAGHKDGDHKDGDHKDGDHKDGDHKDGDHKDGDHKDGDHKDGDHKDGDHKDGDHKDAGKAAKDAVK